MIQTCPLCHTNTNELLPITNPGKGYTECCSRCEQVATLITQNYPYNESWYNEYVPYLPLIINPVYLPIPVENQFLSGTDAKHLLTDLRGALTDKLSETLRKVRSIDVVLCLARLFSDLTYTMSNVTVLKKMIGHAQRWTDKTINPGWFAARLSVLRIHVILLQNLAIKLGSSDVQGNNKVIDIVFELLSLARVLDHISTVQDVLFYNIDDNIKGISIIDKQLIPVTEQLEPVLASNTELYDQIFDELSDPGAGSESDTLNEFYRIAHILDEPAFQAFHFKISDLFQASIGLANFTSKRRRLFVLTPREINDFLGLMLHTDDLRRVEAVASYLKCTRTSAVSNLHEVETFYSPLYVVPVGGYELVILSTEIIDFTRTNFFHNFTYGSHSIFAHNADLHKQYSLLKQTHITAPFEKRTADAFSSLGWKVLPNVKGGILIGKKVVAVVPKSVGEIDFVALSPDRKILIVGDCKYMFDYGATAKEMRTITQRVTGNNSYISQVERKREWVQSHALQISKALDDRTTESPSVTKGIIVTRNRAPFKNNSNTPLVALYDLAKWLEQFREGPALAS
jgi:hypothetical protein